MTATLTHAEAMAWHRGGRGWEKTAVNMTPVLRGAVDKAAKSRGINRAGYIRRALAVLAAHDLGLDWRELVATGPAPMVYGRTAYSRDFPARLRDNGEGYGDWDIVRVG